MPYIRTGVLTILDRVRSAATAAGEQAMSEGDDYAKGLLDTPYPPASAPGESPHKRTGNLQAGVQHAVVAADDGVQFVQGFSRAGGNPNVPTFLQFGTSRMAARPFVDVARDETVTKLHAAVAEGLKALSTD